MTEGALGKLGSGIGETSASITLERQLPGPIEEVWKYLTELKQLPRWLAGGTMDLRVGGAVNLDFDLIQCPGRENMHGTVVGVITELQPPFLLTYSWNEGGNTAADPGTDSIVTFQLTAMSPRETLLVLTHTRVRRRELHGIAAGWHVHLDVLASRLLELEPMHFEIAWTAIEQRYRKER
jgi:uncharacterized protein YndB with AHSA1/START domain